MSALPSTPPPFGSSAPRFIGSIADDSCDSVGPPEDPANAAGFFADPTAPETPAQETGVGGQPVACDEIAASATHQQPHDGIEAVFRVGGHEFPDRATAAQYVQACEEQKELAGLVQQLFESAGVKRNLRKALEPLLPALLCNASDRLKELLQRGNAFAHLLPGKKKRTVRRTSKAPASAAEPTEKPARRPRKPKAEIVDATKAPAKARKPRKPAAEKAERKPRKPKDEKPARRPRKAKEEKAAPAAPSLAGLPPPPARN